MSAPANFRDLPSTVTIGSKEIKQGSGMFDYMRSMNRRKKTPGEQLLARENILSTNSLLNCNTPNELDETAHLHPRHQQAIRSFYYTTQTSSVKKDVNLSGEKRDTIINLHQTSASHPVSNILSC